MAQIWFKNNKAAEKYSEEDITKILEDTLKWVEESDGSPILDEDGKLQEDKLGKIIKRPLIRLKTEVELYLLKTHSVPRTTMMEWINKIHIENKSIVVLKEAIDLILENRLIYDMAIRANIQALVLQNKHNYSERKDIENKHTFAKMPKVMIGEKPLNITGENEDG